MAWPTPRASRAYGLSLSAANGVYHSFSAKHLQRYVSEFAFRLNIRIHTMERIDTLLGMTVGKRITYRDLIEA